MVTNRDEMDAAFLYYSFDSSTVFGSTVVNLGTGGSAYNALMVNNPEISTTDKKAGTGAIAFTAASSQYVQIPAFTTGSSGLTFAFWFKFIDSLTTSRIFDFGNGVGTDNILVWRYETGDLSMQIYRSTLVANEPGVTGLNVNDGVWRHVVLVIDNGGNWKVYLNGALTRTLSNVYYPPSITRALNYLGRSNWPFDPYLNGAIDEFYLFFSVLSASDVLALYNAG
eukprot:gene36457-biopygen6145